MKHIVNSVLLGPMLFSMVNAANVNLYIGTFIENKTNGGYNNAGTLPAVQMAVEHVNKRADILQGYTLKIDVKDSKVWRNIDL